jgi:cardiolipin synthase A/B
MPVRALVNFLKCGEINVQIPHKFRDCRNIAPEPSVARKTLIKAEPASVGDIESHQADTHVILKKAIVAILQGQSMINYGMMPIFANILPWSLPEDAHWLILILQDVAFIAAVIIILRLVHEKRTPSNIAAWSLFLLFLPIIGVPFYLLFGGRKIRRLIAEKNKLSGKVVVRRNVTGANCFGDPIAGNSVRVLGDGVEAYRAFCKEIDNSRESIDIATFILGGDAVGQSIVKRLARKAREGVRVRLLIDALGSMKAKDRMFSQLVEAGGVVERFIPLSFFITREASANLRNHRKIAVFDDRRAIVGGQNMDRRFLSPTYSKELFADLGLIIEGPAIMPLIKVFESDWIFARRGKAGASLPSHLSTPPMSGSSEIEIIPSGPDVEGDPLWECIITLVQEARQSITIVSPYFLPDEVLLRSLIIKSHTGRNVRIVVPENSNHTIVDLARNRFLRQMNAQGIEVLMYRKRMLHAKLIMIDGKFAVSGSANIDPRSFFVNFEIGIVHFSQNDMRLFDEWMTSTILPHCIAFESSRKSRETKSRLFAENMAHLLTPFL